MSRPVLHDACVADLVPHRRGMSWLDSIVSVDAEGAVAEAVVRDDGLFVRGGRMGIWIGIEYMAQAVAAWAGYRARHEGRSIDIGFLLGTRRFETHRSCLQVGDRLRIETRCELMADNGLGMFACRLLVGGVLAASANLSVFEPPAGAFPVSEKAES